MGNSRILPCFFAAMEAGFRFGLAPLRSMLDFRILFDPGVSETLCMDLSPCG